MKEKTEQIEYFGTKKAAHLSRLSEAMVHYLAREEILLPTGAQQTGRGHPRRYTFQDVVMLRILSRLLDSGLEVTRFRKGMKRLRNKISKHEATPESIRFLLTDGKDVFVHGKDGSLESLTAANQLAFSFLIDVSATRAEVVEAMSHPPAPSDSSKAPKNPRAKRRKRRG